MGGNDFKKYLAYSGHPLKHDITKRQQSFKYSKKSYSSKDPSE